MLDAYRDLIDDLVSTPSEVQALVRETGEHQVAAEALRSLRDRDLAIHDRMLTMLKREGALLPPLAAGGGADGDGQGDVATALAGFEQARGEIVSLLMNLTLKDWERSAIQDEGHEVTIADEVETHIEAQETQLAKLRAALGPAGDAAGA